MKADPLTAQPVALFATSPDGRLVALLPQRQATADLVSRERVYVRDRATGDEVFTLDGPDVVRALAWASPTSLLVARDGRRRCSTITLHEAPDGGEVARCELPNLSQHMPTLRFSADGDIALVTAPEAFDCKGPEYEVAHVVALPSLERVADIDCAAIGRSLGLTLRARSQLALHPDGHLVAAVELANGDERDAALALIPAARPDEARIVARGLRFPTSLFWLGPNKLALRVGGHSEGTVVVATLDERFERATLRSVDVDEAPAPRPREPFAVHPDGDRALVVTTGRPAEREAVANSDEWEGDSPQRVEILRCSTGAVVDLGGRYGWVDAACFALNGRYVVSVLDGGREARVIDLETARQRDVPVARDDAWVESVRGGAVVTVEYTHREGWRSLGFIDPREAVEREDVPAGEDAD